MPCRTPSRDFVLDVVQRMRESEEQARREFHPVRKGIQLARARAFDEVYTEMKGVGMDKDPW